MAISQPRPQINPARPVSLLSSVSRLCTHHPSASPPCPPSPLFSLALPPSFCIGPFLGTHDPLWTFQGQFELEGDQARQQQAYATKDGFDNVDGNGRTVVAVSASSPQSDVLLYSFLLWLTAAQIKNKSASGCANKVPIEFFCVLGSCTFIPPSPLVLLGHIVIGVP